MHTAQLTDSGSQVKMNCQHLEQVLFVNDLEN